MTIAIEQYALYRSRHQANDYFPGNLGFDPFQLYPTNANKESQLNMQLAEIKHGRIAMIAITWYAIQEYITQMGIVDTIIPHQFRAFLS
jgi:Chlorophyll A-B binding protein